MSAKMCLACNPCHHGITLRLTCSYEELYGCNWNLAPEQLGSTQDGLDSEAAQPHSRHKAGRMCKVLRVAAKAALGGVAVCFSSRLLLHMARPHTRMSW